MSLENVKSLIGKLKAKADAISKQPGVSVIVGYTAAYAVYVHENLEAHHDTGQAKFLETAASDTEDKVGQVVGKALAAGKTLAQALYLGGLIIQAASQKLCPVDTGTLRASAFTKLETGTAQTDHAQQPPGPAGQNHPPTPG